jgi:hypothetical protein
MAGDSTAMNEVTARLRAAERIAIVAHGDPDPDTIGSGIALGLALERLAKRVSWHCADPVPESIRFLAAADRYSTQPPGEDVDLVVTVDFGDTSRASFALPARPPLSILQAADLYRLVQAGFKLWWVSRILRQEENFVSCRGSWARGEKFRLSQ